MAVPWKTEDEAGVLRSVQLGLRRRLPQGRGRLFGVGAGTPLRIRRAAVTSVALEPIACCVPLAAPAITDEEAAATAGIFRALGDPHRVRIVNLLALSREPVCACELYEPLGLSQSTVSHHLKKLVEAGLLEREQRGKWAYFSLRRDAVEKLAAVADLKGVCC